MYLLLTLDHNETGNTRPSDKEPEASLHGGRHLEIPSNLSREWPEIYRRQFWIEGGSCKIATWLSKGLKLPSEICRDFILLRATQSKRRGENNFRCIQLGFEIMVCCLKLCTEIRERHPPIPFEKPNFSLALCYCAMPIPTLRKNNRTMCT